VSDPPRVRRIAIVREEPLFDKLCVFCGTGFTGPRQQIYCSNSCQQKAIYQRHAEKRRQARRERYQRQKDAKTLD
jgi:hypothetical protein